MKFARYLEETQTPEWKKAYIDYRGLKKRITAIRRAHQTASFSSSDEDLVLSPTSPLEQPASSDVSVARPSADASSSRLRSVDPQQPLGSNAHILEHGHDGERHTRWHVPDGREGSPSNPAQCEHEKNADTLTRPPVAMHSTTVETVAPRMRRGRSNTVTTVLGRALQRANSTKGTASGPSAGLRFDVRRPIPLMELLPQLTPVERAFFEKLDDELDKVESFYCERERDMRHRTNLLKEQLQELKNHRRAFYEAHPAAIAPYSWLPLPLPAPVVPHILTHRRKHYEDALSTDGLSNSAHQLPPPTAKSVRSWKQTFSRRNSSETARPASVHRTSGVVELSTPKPRGKQIESPSGDESSNVVGNQLDHSKATGSQRWRDRSMPKSVQAFVPFRPTSPPEKKGSDTEATAVGDVRGEDAGESSGSGKSAPSSPGKTPKAPKYDPEEYQHAKKQLKKAVLECYRGLEVLNNYRTLNLIGFRKALKKFEKVTRIPAQHAYTREKIEPSAFSSGATVEALTHDLEALFAARFAKGDKKKAMARLRGGSKHTSHHFSTFRTGTALGLAVPALAAGLYKSFQADTREAIPGWDALLYVYAIFFIPTFFALIVGVNLLVWARARINYVFIFELDVRTRMDHRVYFEMPAFLLSLLCYAFWLSFARIGTENVASTTWPLLWLAFAALVMFDPLPMMFKPTRWWLIKNVSKLLTSGMHRVEFADFWMGDQFCSLVFTLSNLYFVACVYATGIDPGWRRCSSGPGPRWGIAFLLGSLPLLVRLVQSVKRYADSGLITHLINGGKYGSGIVYYLFYFLWRSQGGFRGPIFILWCISATNYSLYAGAWDLLMDWSLLRPHAHYPLLRPNILYSNNIPFYYFAIVSNILIRFIWVLYIPSHGPDFVIRTFIAGMLEILRRWQWNFLRLENEHLGNIDQYRVTREVPLPYSYDEPSPESDGDDDEDAPEQTRKRSASRPWHIPRMGPESNATASEAGVADD